MKKRNILFTLICLVLLIGSTYVNISTTNSAKERIITEINNTPIIDVTENKQEISPEPIFNEGELNTDEEETTKSYLNSELAIIIIASVVSIIALLNIIVTKLGKLSLSESLSTNKRLIYYVLSLIILCTALPTITIILSDNKVLNGSETKDRDQKSIAIVEITNDQKASALTKESVDDDTSVIQVSNQSNYIASNLNLIKSNGKSTDTESSFYYGLNSAFIVKDSSNVELKESNITTNTKYSSGFFIIGPSSTALLENVTIKTTNEHSDGITLSDTSELIAEKVNITTEKENSNAIKVINENSSVKINSSKLCTSGINSSLFYSSGKIEATNIEGNSNSSLGIIEGINSLSIIESKLTTNAVGLNNNEKFNSAIFIYKEDSKNASANISNAALTIKDSELSINKESKKYEIAPMFYLTNTKAIINITNSKLNFGSNILLKVESNNEFGDIGDNGADVTFTATDEVLNGNIIVDELSKVRLNLNNTKFKGQINKNNVSKNIDVTFDTNSSWTLTGNSYVNTLTVTKKDLKNIRKYIKSNGYNVYYNAYNNEWLEGKVVKLSGGGKLIPIFKS